MLGIIHIKDGAEFVSMKQIEQQIQIFPYIVTSYFALSAVGSEQVAKVLYKGESEIEAKRAWLHSEPALSCDITFCNILFNKLGGYKGCWRVWLDTKDVIGDEYPGIPKTDGTNYPIGIFPTPDEKLGEPVYTKTLIQSGEDVWYVLRVHDIDLTVQSFIGQVVYKSSSKQEAYDAWKNNDSDKNFYIFNPLIALSSK